MFLFTLPAGFVCLHVKVGHSPLIAESVSLEKIFYWSLSNSSDSRKGLVRTSPLSAFPPPEHYPSRQAATSLCKFVLGSSKQSLARWHEKRIIAWQQWTAGQCLGTPGFMLSNMLHAETKRYRPLPSPHFSSSFAVKGIIAQLCTFSQLTLSFFTILSCTMSFVCHVRSEKTVRCNQGSCCRAGLHNILFGNEYHDIHGTNITDHRCWWVFQQITSIQTNSYKTLISRLFDYTVWIGPMSTCNI